MLVPLLAVGDLVRIRQGDAALLREDEAAQFRSAVPKVRDASGAVRAVARRLCAFLDVEPVSVLKDRDGVPCWPQGLIGSLTHDSLVAAAVVVRPRSGVEGIGIDVEAPCPLEDALAHFIMTPDEARQSVRTGIDAKMVFSIKEAVYKAVYPTDRVFLEFHQVTLDPASRTATTAYGRKVHWRATRATRVLALAWW